MKAEIVSIGDEILIGQILNTNSQWIAQQLNLIGINVCQISTISDNKNHILKALDEAGKRASIILITGGLGPTKDDVTKNALCEYFGTKLIFNKEVYKNIERFISKRDMGMNHLNKEQAEVPENCKIINNKYGTAAGMWFEKNNTVYVSMPGVPFEMTSMMKEEIIPLIKNKFNTPIIIHKTVLTQGYPESELAEKLSDWEDNLPKNMSLAYLPSPENLKLRLSIKGENSELLTKKIDEEVDKLKKLINPYIFGYNKETLQEVVGKLLILNNKTLASAESCTGGNIAQLITSVSGSSKYFLGSVVAYSNNIKTSILNVKNHSLEQYGAVSKQVVSEMAKGIINLFHSDYAIATSGIAGPTGGTEEKPVGTTWIAVASKDQIIAKKFLFGDNRERNIIRASATALNMLRKLILSENK
ncbi:MAG: competence/damage-inducible protein A [Bacteroidetes bacterium]|nr:MAG: competence/damage-inducible protein A [Bacteroidota bacterium]